MRDYLAVPSWGRAPEYFLPCSYDDRAGARVAIETSRRPRGNPHGAADGRRTRLSRGGLVCDVLRVRSGECAALVAQGHNTNDRTARECRAGISGLMLAGVPPGEDEVGGGEDTWRGGVDTREAGAGASASARCGGGGGGAHSRHRGAAGRTWCAAEISVAALVARAEPEKETVPPGEDHAH